MRPIIHRYEDPLDRVWLGAAAAIGLRVRRSEDAYASSDGEGGLVIGASRTLDPDDGLAQMILHELCHSLVEGPESFDRPDWGLDNETARDLEREHACLRTQAYLTSRHGLRAALAPTTEHRVFYDDLGADPLVEDEPSVILARRAVSRVNRDPWAPHFAEALAATAQIVGVAARFVPAGDPSLWGQLEPARDRHPAGGWLHPVPRGSCGDCAWASDGRCAAREQVKVEADWPACEGHTPKLECGDCGACCREAYERIEMKRSDPFATAHPELIVDEGERLAVLRVQGRCPPLEGNGRREPYRCRVYEDRPRTCREFTAGSAHCHDARRRVGLSS